jgi:tRNA modification GTPase
MKRTIAAICTPPGEGAVSMIRISGPESIFIANKIFSGNVSNYQSHTVHFGRILSDKGEGIDEVLLLVMFKGRSYTGEETIEIMCHGGVLVTQKVLQRIFEAGAKAAGPGEFTFMAYQNGKIDLAQAEAVQQLIAAKSEQALKAAEEQLSGKVSLRIKNTQHSLTEITAILEAWVDYPEEGLEFATVEEVIEMLKTLLTKMEKLANTFHEGKAITHGISLCLLGLPNVGKSSLLNALLETNRAIVTDIPGTTRDLLKEDLFFKGLHFQIIDTAGIRSTEEIVEKEGIRRSIEAAQKADIVLILLDITRPLSPEEKDLITLYKDAILIFNKADLPHFPHEIAGIEISALEGTGLEILQEKIVLKALGETRAEKGEVIITKERHFLALNHAIASVQKAIHGLQTEISPEFLVFEMREALRSLATILGTNVTEDILGAIFSKFCVGK